MSLHTPSFDLNLSGSMALPVRVKGNYFDATQRGQVIIETGQAVIDAYPTSDELLNLAGAFCSLAATMIAAEAAAAKPAGLKAAA